MSSELIIANVTMEDNGIYMCKATLNGSEKYASVQVIVHGECVMDRFCPNTFTTV